MPRPASGYLNSAGQKIPGVSDITGRFMDRTRITYWAYGRGKKGLPLYDQSALDIGTCVHTMAELDLKNSSADDIAFYLAATLPQAEDAAKAKASFAAFRAWRAEYHVRPKAQELSLVSEEHQFGGTLDTVAVIRNGLGLLEFKTSAEVFEDHLLQLAAYGMLWEETHPEEPLSAGYHLILLPKNGDKFEHHSYSRAQLKAYRRKFELYREAFALDRVCSDAAMLAGGEVIPSVAPPRVRVKATSVPAAPGTIGELLRSYGHVTNGATA